MIKYLVAIFGSEANAFDGLTALKDLHRNGDITLYASTVLEKDRSGAVSVKQAADSGPTGAAIGVLTGGLVGILGGPAGIVVGASAGGLSGLMFDAYSAGVGADFLDEVLSNLLPGKVALVAEIDEAWTTPVDHRIHEIGGLVFRRLKSEVADDQIVRESAAFDADLKSLQEELRSAAADQKAAIEKNIVAVKAQIKTVQDNAKARLDKAKSEADARVKTLKEQAQVATGRAKARIDERIAAAKADFDTRSTKLNQAWALTKEALAG